MPGTRHAQPRYAPGACWPASLATLVHGRYLEVSHRARSGQASDVAATGQVRLPPSSPMTDKQH